MAKRTSSVFTVTEASQSPPWSKKIRLTDDSVTKDLIRWKIENMFISSGTDVIEVFFSLITNLKDSLCSVWYHFSREN